MSRTVLKDPASKTFRFTYDPIGSANFDAVHETLRALAAGFAETFVSLTESFKPRPFYFTTNYDAFLRDQFAIAHDVRRALSSFTRAQGLVDPTVSPHQERLFDPDASSRD